MKNLVDVIERTISLLRNSEDSLWAQYSTAELIEMLEKHHSNVLQNNNFDKDNLSLLFAPTGSLQEISKHNSWGNEFLQLSSVVDEYTSA